MDFLNWLLSNYPQSGPATWAGNHRTYSDSTGMQATNPQYAPMQRFGLNRSVAGSLGEQDNLEETFKRLNMGREHGIDPNTLWDLFRQNETHSVDQLLNNIRQSPTPQSNKGPQGLDFEWNPRPQGVPWGTGKIM